MDVAKLDTIVGFYVVDPEPLEQWQLKAVPVHGLLDNP